MEGLRLGWAVKAILVMIVTSMLFRCVCAANYSVGGTYGWDLRSNLQLWASTKTFHVGDNLVFTYTPTHDVLEVNSLGYAMCIIANAIAAYDNGETVIPLTEPGTRYFVCGRSRHCTQGLKLRVQVLAQPNNGTGDNNGDGGGANVSRRRPIGPPRRSPPPSRRPPPPPPSPRPKFPSPPSPSNSGESEVPSAAPSHCSGAEGSVADALLLYHGLVPLITLVIFFPSRSFLPQLFA